MGFISFLTADTQESIRNIHTGEHRCVYLLQPHGRPSIEEAGYEGYGVFGEVDAFVWLAMHNLPQIRLEQLAGDMDSLRDYGCEFENAECPYPLKFSFNPNAVYEELPASESDPDQGFF